MMNEHNFRSFTDCYFVKSREAAAKAGMNPRVLWQVFQKKDAIFCGRNFLDTSIFPKAERVFCLNDGDPVAPFEPAVQILARFQDFVEYETIYLGILARCTMVATNVRQVVEVANGKPVLFFPARFDVPEVQAYDGYAAKIGGAAGAATAEQAQWWGNAVGTMPHALIACFEGDTAAATLAFAEARPNEDVWALVDFHNDCARTAVEVFKAMKDKGMAERLKGVRLDTSEKLIDCGIADIVAGKSVWVSTKQFNGVCPTLVRHVRRELDAVGAKGVKIAVSGGFTREKVAAFEAAKVPADVYAVGESFIRGANPYTSDIVAYYDEYGVFHSCGKVGREYRENPRLQLVDTKAFQARTR